MNDRDRMPFGKYQGAPMEEVPASYLLWLWNEGVSHDGVRQYIIDSFSALEKYAPDVIVKRRPT